MKRTTLAAAFALLATSAFAQATMEPQGTSSQGSNIGAIFAGHTATVTGLVATATAPLAATRRRLRGSSCC